MQSKLRA